MGMRDTGLAHGTFVQLLKFKSKCKTNPIGKWAKDMNRYFMEEVTDGQRAHKFTKIIY